jgi:hypothetical protein
MRKGTKTHARPQDSAARPQIVDATGPGGGGGGGGELRPVETTLFGASPSKNPSIWGLRPVKTHAFGSVPNEAWLRGEPLQVGRPSLDVKPRPCLTSTLSNARQR